MVVDTDPTDRVKALADLGGRSTRCSRRKDCARALIGAGFSVSGFKTGRAGTYVAPIPLSDWSNRDLRPEIMAALGLPVWLENNATAGAIGEAMVGVGLVHDTFAYLSFNYGFGGGIVVDGAATGRRFRQCRRTGRHLHARRTTHRPALGGADEAAASARHRRRRTISELARRYDPAWPGIEEWLVEVAPQLNLVIRALRAIVDPTAIVFGGEAPRDLRRTLDGGVRNPGARPLWQPDPGAGPGEFRHANRPCRLRLRAHSRQGDGARLGARPRAFCPQGQSRSRADMGHEPKIGPPHETQRNSAVHTWPEHVALRLSGGGRSLLRTGLNPGKLLITVNLQGNRTISASFRNAVSRKRPHLQKLRWRIPFAANQRARIQKQGAKTSRTGNVNAHAGITYRHPRRCRQRALSSAAYS